MNQFGLKEKSEGHLINLKPHIYGYINELITIIDSFWCLPKTKALSSELLIKSIRVRTSFSQKYKFDFDAIYSVFCFTKHESNKIGIWPQVWGQNVHFRVILCFAKYDFHAINFKFLENTD